MIFEVIRLDKRQVAQLLKTNITKTMGCTDIGVVGYIASIGAYTLRNTEIKSVNKGIIELI